MHLLVATRRNLLAIAAAVAVLAASVLIGSNATTVIAQDSGESGHPNHIHAGTCDQPGDITVPLGNIGTEYVNFWEPAESVESVGQDSAVTVISASTPVDAPLSAFLESEHMLMVHESEENLQNFIACGNIGGNLVNGTDLQFGIEPLNNSGVSGIGWLMDDGDGTSTLYVFLVGSEEAAPLEGSFGASPEPDDAEEATETDEANEESASAFEVDIVGFAYDPTPLEVSVGDTVTWTNGDGVPHTATQSPSGSGFQSGTIQGGASFEFTFDEAGEFEYFCEFHPNMNGTVVVSE